MEKENNFTQLALSNGFTAFPNYFNPINNWFGCSRTTPDFELTKGNKVITLSLQGGFMPMPNDMNKYKELLKQVACKYLAFKIDNKIVYETFTGELPPMEFMQEFISTASYNSDN